MNQPKTLAQKAGFTLIELSIVLVIIGLIVGGVLVGQDLIKAAEIRATISQLEKYEAAANTFRGKYNGIPGDIANPTTYGLSGTNIGSNTGNGLVNRNSDTHANIIDQEAAAFFPHLFTANLIGDSASGSDFLAGSIDTLGSYFPVAKMGRANYVIVMSISGLNYMYLQGASDIEDGVITDTTGSITPVEAFNIDSKRDDGVPNTGTVIAVNADASDITAADAGTSSPGAADCWDSDAPAHYAMDATAAANVAGCALRLRASF